MKKILLVVCAIMATATLFAQDIIVTKDAKKIDAKILEVSKTEIKYKEFNYQDGPTFVLGVEDINSIIYANGNVVIYKQEVVDDSKNYQIGSLFGNTKKDEGTEQKVTVDFDIERTSNPMWFNFTNLSSGATEFRWDFGDGTWTIDRDAMKVFENPGTYTVTLTTTVGDRQYIQRKMVEVGGTSQQEQALEKQRIQAQLDRLQEQAKESGTKMGQAIGELIQAENSYALDIQNTTKHPYKINLDGHILGVVNPYKTQRFIVSVETYGRMQAVQTSGYRFSPTIKEFKIPRQQKNTACTVVIK